MRVTILSRGFPPTVGGISDHTDHLATHLAARDADVTVVTSRSATDDRDAFGVMSVVDDWSARGERSIVDAVIASEPHAILWQYNPFAYGPKGLAAGAGALARALAEVAPLTAYLHEMWFPWGRNGLKGATWAVAQRRQTRRVLDVARAWIVTTDDREAHLSRRDASKTHRIPVGPGVEPVSAADRPSFDLPDDAFVVAHFGGVGPGRDLDPTLSALRTLRAEGLDVRLLLCGDTGPDAPSGDGIHVTGVLPRERLSAALASADAYLHLDPAGPAAGRKSALVSAIAHGLPLVAYDGPQRASELVPGENVVVVDREARAVSDVLRSLAEDPVRRADLSEAILETYQRSFTWRHIAERVHLVLSS